MHAMSAPVLLYPVARDKETTVEKPTELSFENISQTAHLVSLGLMAKNLGHEINSPVSLLMAKLEDLSAKTDSRTLTEDFLKTELGRLLAATQRLAKVTRSLRALNYDGKQTSVSKFFLSQALQRSLDLNLEKINRYGIELSQTVASNLIVEGRLGDLSHAFFNLLNNSIEALSQTAGPRLQIEAYRNEVGIRIEIRDNRNNEEVKRTPRIPKPILTAVELSASDAQIQLAVAAEIFQAHQGRFYCDFQSTEHSFILELPDFQKNGRAHMGSP